MPRRKELLRRWKKLYFEKKRNSVTKTKKLQIKRPKPKRN